MSAALRRIVRATASLWVTAAGIAFTAILVLAGEDGAVPVGSLIALPFALLFVNLLASIATREALRRQKAILAFHLALAALALIVSVDRLMAFSGHVEITEGTAFDPMLVEATSGPLHPWHLNRIRFSQGDFNIAYKPGMKRRETESTVYVANGDGAIRQLSVGDDHPLVLGGYRFYTSFNKGFAPLLSYRDRTGTTRTGAVHMPSYPLNHFRQGNVWQPSEEEAPIKLWLHLPNAVFDEASAWNFRKPENPTLVVIADDERHELKYGETLHLAHGLMRFEGLRIWMGYVIAYNPLMPWMLAAIVVAIACLTWHVAAKFRESHWDNTSSISGARSGI